MSLLRLIASCVATAPHPSTRDVHRDPADGPEHARSPSPPPRYDTNGVRQNTREMRIREKMVEQRSDLIGWLVSRCPHMFRPPADWRPSKKTRKLVVPLKEFPGYNFIGLVIGPRGNTQKRMQRETNTRIAIRGRGGAPRHLQHPGTQPSAPLTPESDSPNNAPDAEC